MKARDAWDKKAAMGLLNQAKNMATSFDEHADAVKSSIDALLDALHDWQLPEAHQALKMQLTAMLEKFEKSAADMTYQSDAQGTVSRTSQGANDSSSHWTLRLWESMKAQLPVRRVGQPLPHLSQDEAQLIKARLLAIWETTQLALARGQHEAAKEHFVRLKKLLQDHTSEENYRQQFAELMNTIESQALLVPKKSPDFAAFYEALAAIDASSESASSQPAVSGDSAL